MGDRSGGQDMLRREYDRINAKWLNAHFRAGAGLAAFICLMEAVVYFALREIYAGAFRPESAGRSGGAVG